MKLYLGVDGGQSGTKVLVGDETGALLGRGAAGPCNHVGAAEGRAKLIRSLREALEAALADALILGEGVRFAAAYFGMSGGPADKREVIASIVAADRLEVATDAHAALLGAFGGGPGAVVIAGTGSMALASDGRGFFARAGGWGYVFGDEGGAFDIARRALRRAVAAEEGWGPPTRLLADLLAATGAPSANDLMHWFYTDEWPRSRVASLASLVDQVAARGDLLADDVLEEAGEALADYGLAAAGRVFAKADAPRVAYVGGVFQSRRVLAAFERRLRANAGVGAAAPLHGPEVGALLGAYRLGGLPLEGIRIR